MQRSQALGHCVCDPHRPCPCDVLLQRDICPCAGERPEPRPAGSVKLTELVRNAGCASKIPAAQLEAVLSRLPEVKNPAVLSGLAAGDDAGIYALTDGVTLVQTVDVFTPCVDDARVFGRICAANCLSDIYAMGGTPLTALSILAFPSDTLDHQLMYEMLSGAMEVLAEAGVALLGGHSIKDEEIKLGFAVTGVVAEAAIERGNAQVGDLLVLTKPLGTGVLTFCRQIGRGEGIDFTAMEESMCQLNRAAATAMRAAGASACTDITGFGLLGHAIGMARHSGVTVELWADAVPAYGGAVAALAAGVIPGAIERNAEHVGADLEVCGGVEPARLHLALDAQTSGGLLISIDPQRHERLLELLGESGVAGYTIGRIVERSSGRIRLCPTAPAEFAGKDQPIMAKCCDSASSSDKPAAHSGQCCASPAGGTLPGTSAAAQRAFGEFMKAASAAGALDEKTKELIALSLVVLSRCESCLEVHIEKARRMGITQAEMDEAAWLAVAMGGAPVRMFYNEVTGRKS